MRIISKIFIMLCCVSIATVSYAKTPSNNALDEIIRMNALSKTSIVSVSLKNLDEKAAQGAVYEKNSTLLLHPASTLKLFTSAADMYTLGHDSAISTGIYKFNNKFYLKLSGDPLLKKEDLTSLFESFKSKGYTKVTDLNLDATALDDTNWGEGWMQDDSTNQFMPQFSVFNIDGNLAKIKIIPTTEGKPAVLAVNKTGANFILQNNILTGDRNNVKAERNFWKDPEKISLSGTVKGETSITVPIYDVKKYFMHNLLNTIKQSGVELKGNIIYSGTPFNAEPVALVSHSVSQILSDINQNSDNMASETLFKIAGAAHTQDKATTQNGIKLFDDFYKALNSDTDKISIVDASGASFNDLLTTDWMTTALFNLYKSQEFDSLKATMAAPGQNGTLKDRLPELTGKLYAKTGTLAGVSSITGYVTTQSGNKYAFAIMTQNYKGSSSAVKDLEDELLTAIYQKY